MGTPLTYYREQPLNPKVGDVWTQEDFRNQEWMSDDYKSSGKATRAPLVVKLPDGTYFCLDSRCTAKTSGWNVKVVGELVEGQKPDITVTPSIRISTRIKQGNDWVDKEIFHGHITNGVITGA